MRAGGIEMFFEHPKMLLLLLLLTPVSLLGVWGWRFRKKKLVQLFLLPKKENLKRQIEKYLLASAIIALTALGIASPRISYSGAQVVEKTGEVIFLVDVSMSMAARKDLDAPSRLERARAIIKEVLLRFPAVKGSVCGFTGLARCFSPLTQNHLYLQRTTDRVLDINSVPGSGSNILHSIEYAISKFSQRAGPKILVLFTDGENFSTVSGSLEPSRVDLEKVAQQLEKRNVLLFVVGVGEREGATIPLYDAAGTFVKYAGDPGSNTPYLTYLNESFLRDLAAAAQGKYFFEADVSGLERELAGNLIDKKSVAQNSRSATYLLLIPIVVLSALFFRRHVR